jgi:multiple sugar transport system substrate-binding protein
MEVQKGVTRRTFLTMSAGMASLAALAACTAAPAAAPAPAGGEAEGTAPDQEVVELRLTFWGDLADMPTWNWGLEQFHEQNPGIRIRWENTPWTEYWTKLQTEAAAGTIPDVVGMVSMYSQQYIRQNTLKPLNTYIEREPDVNVDDFWPVIMPAYRWEGETYAFPYDLSTMAIFYNKNLFDEAGVAYPTGSWTWDEFLDACQKMTKDTGSGRIDQWGWLLPIFDWTIDVPLSTNGASWFNEDDTICTMDTPEAIETVQWLADLRLVHGVVPTIAEQGDVPLFETGRAAMTWGNPEAVQVIATRVGPPRENDKFLWDVALFPHKVKDGNAVAGGSFAIGTTTEHPEEAWKFVKFYTSAPILEEMVGVPSRGIPGRASVSQSLITDTNPEHQQFFLDVLDYASPTFIPTYQQATAIMRKYLDMVFLGEATAAEVAPQMTAEINALSS